MPSFQAFLESYESGVAEMIARREMNREAFWTESLAIGDREFVERAAKDTCHRSQFEYEPVAGNSQGWSVRENGVT